MTVLVRCEGRGVCSCWGGGGLRGCGCVCHRSVWLSRQDGRVFHIMNFMAGVFAEKRLLAGVFFEVTPP